MKRGDENPQYLRKLNTRSTERWPQPPGELNSRERGEGGDVRDQVPLQPERHEVGQPRQRRHIDNLIVDEPQVSKPVQTG